MHAGQAREVDGAPFITHPREVASLLYHAGACDHLIAAGALHDVIEKTPARASELRRRFGGRIASLVLAVSEDAQIASYSARKAALRRRVAEGGEDALLLFAADKVSKARELRLESSRADGGVRRSSEPVRCRASRLSHYRRCLELLKRRLPDSPLVAQLDAELRGVLPLPVTQFA